MTGSARRRNVVFSVATLLTLGFGAVQAFAAPRAQADAARRACSLASCDYGCRSRGYLGGLCDEVNGTQYCECYGWFQRGK